MDAAAGRPGRHRHGGAAGFGKGAVRRVVAEGAKVVIADLSADRGHPAPARADLVRRDHGAVNLLSQSMAVGPGP